MNEAHELLRRALEWVEYDPKLVEDIRTYLANQETAKDEPVAWMFNVNDLWIGEQIILTKTTMDKDYAHSLTHYDITPLYLHPAKPEAEPVTDEILEQHIENGDGRWVDGEFRIDGPDLMSLLRAVSKPTKPDRKPMTDEPIAYINLDEQRLEFAKPFQFNRSAFKQGKLPLYLHPTKPDRKPMTEEEIAEEFGGWANDFNEGVIVGIRYAEKHHGIGEKDDSST